MAVRAERMALRGLTFGAVDMAFRGLIPTDDLALIFPGFAIVSDAEVYSATLGVTLTVQSAASSDTQSNTAALGTDRIAAFASLAPELVLGSATASDVAIYTAETKDEIPDG